MSFKSPGSAALTTDAFAAQDSVGVGASTYPYKELPPALVTGHKFIDFEHQLLLNSMASLRQVCTGFSANEGCESCVANSRFECEGSLVSLLGDLLVFMMDHFQHEERLMRDSLLMMVDRDLCEAHMEDHAAISGKVQQIIARLNPMRISALIRELDALLHGWLTHHVSLHDLWLVRWTEREESVLRTAIAGNR